jgi:hypothetical protein
MSICYIVIIEQTSHTINYLTGKINMIKGLLRRQIFYTLYDDKPFMSIAYIRRVNQTYNFLFQPYKSQ